MFEVKKRVDTFVNPSPQLKQKVPCVVVVYTIAWDTCKRELQDELHSQPNYKLWKKEQDRRVQVK